MRRSLRHKILITQQILAVAQSVRGHSYALVCVADLLRDLLGYVKTKTHAAVLIAIVTPQGGALPSCAEAKQSLLAIVCSPKFVYALLISFDISRLQLEWIIQVRKSGYLQST